VPSRQPNASGPHRPHRPAAGEARAARTRFCRYPLFWFIAIPATALLLRTYQLAGTSLWLDEAFSYWFATRSLGDLWTVVPTFEPHSPLYYTLLKAWLCWGDSREALKGFSVFISLLTLPFVFLLGRLTRPRGLSTGLIGAALFAVSPLNVYFGQAARPYAAFTLATAIMLCGAARLVARPPNGDIPGAWAAWGLFVLGAALTLWFHNVGPIYVAAIGLALLVYWAGTLRYSRSFLACLLFAGVLILALYSPYLTFLWARTKQWMTGNWIPELTLRGLASILFQVFGVSGSYNKLLKFALALLFAGLSLWGLVSLRRHNGKALAALMAASIGLPTAALATISFALEPILQPRTLIAATVPFYVTMAAGIDAVENSRLRNLLLAATLTALTLGSLAYRGPNEPWRDIAAYLQTHAAKNDVVLLLPNSTQIPMDYYLRDSGTAMTFHPLPAPFPALGDAYSHPSGNGAEAGIAAADIPAIESSIAAVDRVWLITRAPELFDPHNLVHPALEKGRYMALRKAWEGVVLSMYQKVEAHGMNEEPAGNYR
jgi:mannosyltransferase